MVEDEVGGVAREVDGEEEGEGEVEARKEIFSEEVTIREQNTTAEILCDYLCMYRIVLSRRAFQDADTCNSIVRIQPAMQDKEK